MHILIFKKTSPNMKYDLMFQTPCKHRTFSYMVYYFLKMYLFSFICIGVLQHMYVFHRRACNAHRIQKGASDPLELEVGL